MTDTKHYNVESLADPAVRLSNRVFMFEGMEIHSQFMPATAETDTLIIRFHGAVQRDKRALPAFQANLAQMASHCHQLTICDPTMMTREGFSLGWYTGHETLDVQSILSRFFKACAETLGTKRHIYLGSSGGGFAALYYSHQHAESVAVVLGPQTSIHAHIPKAVEAYLQSCWPGKTLDEVSELRTTDLCQLYRDGHDNTVIYVQSTGDFLHNYRHLAPFVEAVHSTPHGKGEDSDFLLISDFWGRPGHAGAIPHDSYIPWLRAALAAQSRKGVDILAAYSPPSSKPAAPSSRESVKQGPAEGFDEGSLQLADRLRDYHLRKVEAQ